MSKTLSLIVLFVLAVSVLPSCKKCYSCVDTCSSCVLLDSATHAIVSQATICSDSLWYQTVKDSLITAGFTCTSAPSKYKDNWCVNNKDAVAQYLPYHEGNGMYTCSPN